MMRHAGILLAGTGLVARWNHFFGIDSGLTQSFGNGSNLSDGTPSAARRGESNAFALRGGLNPE